MFKFILSAIRINRKFNSRRHQQRPTYNAPQFSGQRAYTTQAQSAAALNDQIQNLPKVTVRWVIDGDSIIATKGWHDITIRLDAIDCPEDGQYWGDIAKYGLIKLIGGKTVYLEDHGIDLHGRTLATIYIRHRQKNEWLNINERMVTLGHAWVMRRFYDHLPKDRQDKLNRLESWARSKKIGLWHASDPIPPWEWRREG